MHCRKFGDMASWLTLAWYPANHRKEGLRQVPALVITSVAVACGMHPDKRRSGITFNVQKECVITCNNDAYISIFTRDSNVCKQSTSSERAMAIAEFEQESVAKGDYV